MPLLLSILRCPDDVPPETRQVSGGDFSIGRGSENDWVLPDPERLISKRHCVVAYRGGAWQIAGVSGNGTFLNHDREPLESGPPRALEDGDRIHIGSYEIEVRTQEEAARAAAGGDARRQAHADPFGDDPFREPRTPGPGPNGGSHDDLRASPFQLPAGFDPLASHFAEDGFAGPTPGDHSPAMNDALHLQPLRPVLPDDWDLETSAELRLPTPTPAPTPAPPAVATVTPGQTVNVLAAPGAPADGETDLLAAFLRGARMPDAVLADPVFTMERLGAAFRATVSGLRLALVARAAVKQEFRIEQTTVGSSGNNPLKFSVSDDDTMAALLGVGRRAEISAEDAMADALSDIRLHELVSMAAMQVAVRSLVARLAPEGLRRSAEKAGGIGWPGAAKVRAWDMYETLHDEITQSLTDDFDNAFGKNFARAYEQALAEISRRDRRK